jgi:hypothetical protein
MTWERKQKLRSYEAAHSCAQPKNFKIYGAQENRIIFQNWLQPIVKVVGALLRYLYNDAVLFSDVTIDLMTIADKYNLKALFNRCDFYIAQALRSCQLTGEDVKVNFRLLQFRAVGRSGYLVEI